MRFVAITVFAALLAGAASAQVAGPTVPARKNAEDCLRTRVAAAVESSSGAADAATFLLDYLCAGPVAAAGLYERNSTTLEGFQGMLEGMEGDEPTGMEGLSVNPVTGEMVSKFAKDEAEAMGAMVGLEMLGGMGMFNGGQGDLAPIYLRELAATLITQQRARP